MPNTPIHIPNFYEYLQKENIDQENLTDKEYIELRKQYGRFRNRLYKQRQRLVNRECPIFLNAEEYSFLNENAKRHNLQIGLYIKHASLSYSKSTFLIPDKVNLKEILLKLEDMAGSIDKISEKSSNIFTGTNRYSQLSATILEMKEKVLHCFENPVNIESWLKREIKTSGAFRKNLINLLLNPDFDH